MFISKLLVKYSLRLSVLTKSIAELFFAEKLLVACALQKLLTFLAKNISGFRYLFEILMSLELMTSLVLNK